MNNTERCYLLSIIHYPLSIIAMRLSKVKSLISEGKTQQAIDLLQEILKDKDNQLLNQTFLLEGQHKELQRKMQLGLQDASAELNRINFTLLSLCDDATNLPNIGDDADEKPFTDDEKPTGLAGNPLAIFGILAAVGIATVIGIFVLVNNLNDKKTTGNPIATAQNGQVVPPSVKGAWQAAPAAATVIELRYGNVKTDILSIETTEKDAKTSILTMEFKFTCLKASSGVCILNYLDFRIVSPSGDKIAPTDYVLFDNNLPAETTTTKKISFVLPKTIKQADLEIYYRDKKDNTLTTIKLHQ